MLKKRYNNYGYEQKNNSNNETTHQPRKSEI